MTLQTSPIPAGVFGDTPQTRDRRVLGIEDTLRPTFSLREALDGTSIRMRFAWQQTHERWIHELRTNTGATIRLGLGLIAPGVDLWAPVQYDPRMPGGQLWIAWEDQNPRRPGRYSFREGARLYYRPAELRALVVGTELALL